MKISEAIANLEKLRKIHGDVEVFADCAKCGHETLVGLVVPVQKAVTIKLAGKEK